MRFFRRQPESTVPPSAPAPSLDIGQALELVLVKSVESQAGLAQKISEMVISQMEGMTNLYAKRLGSRGGRKSAQNRKRNADGTWKPKRLHDCRLCENPSISNPTADEIRAHINHESPAMNYRIENGAVHVDMDAAAIETRADGEQVVECPDCASGVSHDHHQH